MPSLGSSLPLGLALAVVLGLGACSPPAGAPAAPAEPTPAAKAPTGASPDVALDALSPDDLQRAALPGELGCSFAAQDGAPLLVAMGVVASPQDAIGVVKASGAVERVTALGGYDAMIEGATFTGAGMTIRIAVTGPASGGGESPPRPATLTYDRTNGPRRSVEGSWSCGP